MNKPFLFMKKKTLWKREIMNNNIEHIGNEDYKERNLGFCSCGAKAKEKVLFSLTAPEQALPKKGDI